MWEVRFKNVVMYQYADTKNLARCQCWNCVFKLLDATIRGMVESIDRRQTFYQEYSGQLHARFVQDIGRILETEYQNLYPDPIRLDIRVAEALATVPRHLFVPGYSFSRTYRDKILGLEDEGALNGASTASEPSLVAFMTQLVIPDGDMVNATALDVGSGSGYQTAILSAVGFSRVTGVEIKPHLAKRSRELLKDTPGVRIITGDAKNLSPRRKFDAIVVAAQANNLDHVRKLRKHLRVGGKMIIPISVAALAQVMAGDDPELAKQADEKGLSNLSVLSLFTRTGRNTFREDPKTVVRFVDLI